MKLVQPNQEQLNQMKRDFIRLLLRRNDIHDNKIKPSDGELMMLYMSIASLGHQISSYEKGFTWN